MTRLRKVPNFRELKGGTCYLLLRDKPGFLDPQLLDFPVQRRLGNSEFRCRTFRARKKGFSAPAERSFLRPAGLKEANWKPQTAKVKKLLIQKDLIDSFDHMPLESFDRFILQVHLNKLAKTQSKDRVLQMSHHRRCRPAGDETQFDPVVCSRVSWRQRALRSFIFLVRVSP